MIDIQVYCDCDDVVASIFSTKDVCKSVRVRSDIGRMKQIIDRKEIALIYWIPSEQQSANSMTKSKPSLHSASAAASETSTKNKEPLLFFKTNSIMGSTQL